MTTTIVTACAIIIAISLFTSLVRQTIRAERAERALARVEAEIASTSRSIDAKALVEKMRARAREIDAATAGDR